MKIYLTTDAKLSIDAYTCRLWLSRPELFEPTGEWRHNHAASVFVGYFPLSRDMDNLAALGFPPPGKIRILETGPCEEGE